MRRERANPGSVARALDRWAAQGKLGERAKATRDGLLTLVSDGVYHRSPGAPSPVRLVGGAEEDDIRRVGPEGRELPLDEEARLEFYNGSRRELARIDPTNPLLKRPYITVLGGSIPTQEQVEEIARAVERARVNGPTPEGPVNAPLKPGRPPDQLSPPPWETLDAPNLYGGVTSPTPRDGVMSGVPTGTPADATQGNANNQRGLRRENEAAASLAAEGYRVEQKPSWQPGDTFDPNKMPDLRVGGNIFDVYSPTTSDLDNLRDGISEKIKVKQTSRVVVNLADSPVTPQQVTEILFRKLIANLREVFIIDQQKQIRQVFPLPTATSR